MATLSVADVIVGEGDRFVDVVVRLSAPATSKVTVNYATIEWTADEGAYYDYVPRTGTLSFNPGETTQVVRIDLVESRVTAGSDVETDQRFKFVLSNPGNATLAGEGFAWVTIVDNDTVMDNPELWVRDVTVDEAAGTASFVVQLGRIQGQSSASTVTVDYATADGSAASGQDYSPTSGRLTFLPGESVKTVTVPLVNDAVAEPAESFSLLLSNPSTAVIVKGGATATIGANDAPPVAQPKVLVSDMTVGEGDHYLDVVVSLSAPATSKVTVNYATIEWTADEGAYYDYVPRTGTLSFNPGETTQVVRIDLVESRVTAGSDVESLERFKFALSNPGNATLAGEGFAWVTIVDNDTVMDNPELWVRDVIVDETAGVARFVVSLGRTTGQVGGHAVTVDFATADGTAKAGTDYVALSGSLTFLPGESTQTINVPLINDALTEPMEYFDLVLKNPATGVIVDGHARALIEANDGVAAGQPTLSCAGAVVSEDEGMVDVLVSLSAPSARTVTVKYATANGTATGGSYYDYIPASGTLTFAPGETAKVVQVQIANDNIAEGAEKFRFTLSAPANALLGTPSAEVLIADAKAGDAAVRSLGLGNDVYEVTSTSDIFLELDLSLGGSDTVMSYVNGYTLPAGLDNLVLAHPSVTDGNGNAGHNTFIGNGANNRFDGKAGVDTAVFSGPAAAYRIIGTVDSRTVSGGADGTDTLLSVERLRFSDTIQAWDTTPGGQTYLAYAFINAAFNRAPTIGELSRWTAELGLLGGDTIALAQQMINAYAPGVGDADLVAHLWGAVVETPLAAGELANLVSLLRSGALTQASLFDLAAQHPLNTVELTGIAGAMQVLDPSYFPMPPL